jgi:hypothetical protein
MTSTETQAAVQTLAALRRELLRWEDNLTANAEYFDREGCEEAAAIQRAKLDIVRETFAIIGR